MYGPGSYTPDIPVTYWSFRLMIGFGLLAGSCRVRRPVAQPQAPRDPARQWFCRAALCGIALPYLANTAGWLFTEMGRQPWTVFGLMQTTQSVSPAVTSPR